jgi:hypothetical protein
MMIKDRRGTHRSELDLLLAALVLLLEESSGVLPLGEIADGGLLGEELIVLVKVVHVWGR